MSEDAHHCGECEYLRLERAGMEMEAGLSVPEADAAAAGERCAEHRAGSAGIKVTVVAYVSGSEKLGEYIGWPRTLAGPFRYGTDGTHDEVQKKYRRWLFDQVQSKGAAHRKLLELLDKARTREGLILNCTEVEVGNTIKKCLEWMNGQVNHSAGRTPESEGMK